jgi:hypothetical protein
MDENGPIEGVDDPVDELARMKAAQAWHRLRVGLVNVLDAFDGSWPLPRSWNEGKETAHTLAARTVYGDLRLDWEAKARSLVRAALMFPDGAPDADDVERIADVNVTASWSQAIEDFVATCTAVGFQAQADMNQILDEEEDE